MKESSQTAAEQAHQENGSGRRYQRPGVRVPMLTKKLADAIADDLRESLLPARMVAEKHFIPEALFRKWLSTGKRGLEKATEEEGHDTKAQEYLYMVVSKANAERLEGMAVELYKASPQRRSHSFGQWLMSHASPCHLGILANRDLEREAAQADIEAGIKGKAQEEPIDPEVSELTDEQLAARLAAKRG